MVANLYECGRPTAGAGYRMARTCCRYRRPQRRCADYRDIAILPSERRRSRVAQGHQPMWLLPRAVFESAWARYCAEGVTPSQPSHTSATVEPSQLSPAVSAVTAGKRQGVTRQGARPRRRSSACDARSISGSSVGLPPWYRFARKGLLLLRLLPEPSRPERGHRRAPARSVSPSNKIAWSATGPKKTHTSPKGPDRRYCRLNLQKPLKAATF